MRKRPAANFFLKEQGGRRGTTVRGTTVLCCRGCVEVLNVCSRPLMAKVRLMGVAFAVLAWAGTALAAPTTQESCDYARATAWRLYLSCIETAVAKEAKGTLLNPNAAFALCRHTYSQKWLAFQRPRRTPSLAGSTCSGSRFTDNGDGTVTDNLSGLMWETKDDSGGIHDTDSSFTWSTSGAAADGSAFADFLESLNTTGLGQLRYGHIYVQLNDWRLPTVAELQTIALDFACIGAFGGPSCVCPTSPCVDPALDAAHTQASAYWTSTSTVPTPTNAWTVAFDSGAVSPLSKTGSKYVRAVRGGL